MKAIRIHKFGATEDVLQYEDVPMPKPKADEVLIKVEAAALNRADLSLRKGAYRISPDQLPVIPGREFAGKVEELGRMSASLKSDNAWSVIRVLRLCGIRGG
jgi:NADPH:quinone reductase-like Zn-dependent oxidoreductase